MNDRIRNLESRIINTQVAMDLVDQCRHMGKFIALKNELDMLNGMLDYERANPRMGLLEDLLKDSTEFFINQEHINPELLNSMTHDQFEDLKELAIEWLADQQPY